MTNTGTSKEALKDVYAVLAFHEIYEIKTNMFLKFFT